MAVPVLVAQLRDAVHSLNNVGAVLLGNWAAVRAHLKTDPAVWAIGADIDLAGDRLLAELAKLTQLCILLSKA